VTAAGVAVAVVARAGTASPKRFLVIGAVLAAALVAGCGGGSKEQTYSIGPTGACLREAGERAVEQKGDATTLRLNFAFLRFHPTIDDAKAFDVSTLATNFGGYEYHRKRYGNVSLIWATGGPGNVSGPGQDEVDTIERCLRA
jgi:hypothetical protein